MQMSPVYGRRGHRCLTCGLRNPRASAPFLRQVLHEFLMEKLAKCIEGAKRDPMQRKFDEFRRRLKPGRVYRRADLAQWSTSVDRHLRQALDAGVLRKLAGGLYYVPKKTVFGDAPAEDGELVSTFLKGDDYLLASPNAYNGLGLGTTQLKNRTVVYNHKRHGRFSLGGRTFEFRMKHRFPKTLSREFLLVDLVNNVGDLGEEPRAVLERVRDRAFDGPKLKKAARDYGSERTKRFFAQTNQRRLSASVAELEGGGER